MCTLLQINVVAYVCNTFNIARNLFANKLAYIKSAYAITGPAIEIYSIRVYFARLYEYDLRSIELQTFSYMACVLNSTYGKLNALCCTLLCNLGH